MSPNHAYLEKVFMGSGLNCGSIRSSDKDDIILSKVYEVIDSLNHGCFETYSLSLCFTDTLQDDVDPKDLIEHRLESLHYRNFYDWNAQLQRLDDWRYRLVTRGHALMISTRCFRRIFSGASVQSTARILITIATA